MLQLCPGLQAARTVGSHMFLKPGELRSATSTLGRLHSIGEPTLATEEVHAPGHWIDRL